MEKGPFRTAKFYEYAGDLREYGHRVRLNLFCQMDKTGNHKLELIDVGEMSRANILREIGEIFAVDFRSLGVMRIDFAVDVAGLPIQWFRETVRAEHKRFRAAVTGEPFYSEMGSQGIQTLYFGKRPNVIRIYDKIAEYRHQYRTMIRSLEKGFEPAFESVFPTVREGSILTRVERQIGGRIPTDIDTLGKLFEPGFRYEPFAKLKIIDHPPMPLYDSNYSFETLCTGLYLRGLAQQEGLQAMREFASKHSKGNAGWVMKKYGSFLPSATPRNRYRRSRIAAAVRTIARKTTIGVKCRLLSS